MEPHSFPRRPGGLTALVLDALDAKDAKDTSLFESVTDGALHEAKKPRVPDRTELKLAIQELEDEIDRVKTEIDQTVQGNYKALKDEYATKLALHREVAEFFAELDAVIDNVENSDSGVRVQIESLLERHETLQSDLFAAEELVSLLLQIAEWHSHAESLRRSLASSSYLAAAHSYLETCRLLSIIWERCPEAKIVEILKEDTERGGSTLEARCEEGLAASLVFSSEGLEVRRSGGLDEIAKVLHLLGAATASHHLAPFTRGLLKNVILPVIDKKWTVEADEESEIPTLTMAAPLDGSGSSIGELYVVLFDIFNFIHSVVFRDNQNFFCGIIGAAIWDELAPVVVEKWLEPLVPDQAGDLDAFASVQAETEDFMKTMEEQGFVESEERFGALMAFCNDIEARFVERKRKTVLAKARTMILAPTHEDVKWKPPKEGKISLPLPSTVPKTSKGTDQPAPTGFQLSQQEVHPSLLAPLFPLPNCTLSALAPGLLDLVSSLLVEAATAPSNRCARDLVHLARGLPRLYRAVKSKEEVPVLAARMHNDCHFLATGLEGLGVRWREAIRRGPAGTEDAERAKVAVTFASEADELRRMGRHVLNLQLCTQKDELLACLSSAGGFEMAEESREQELARSVKQTIYMLDRLGRVWKYVLPANVYLLSIGLLVGAVCDSAITEIESLKDIGADESARMNRTLEAIRKGCFAVFADAIDGTVDSKEGTEEERTTFYAYYYAPSLKKLALLAKILDSSFAAIMELFRAGELRGFALGELTGLFRAIFADTQLRQRNLEEILRGHPPPPAR